MDMKTNPLLDQSFAISPVAKIRAESLHRALALLKASNAKYKVIAETGEQFGVLEVVPERSFKRKQNNPAFKHGERALYVLRYLEPMQPGDAVVIPLGPYGMKGLKGNVSPLCHRLWGAGNSITEISEEGVTVLRIE